MSLSTTIQSILLEKNILSQEKIQRLLAEQKKTGDSLHSLILQKKLIEENQLNKLLAEKFRVPFVNLSDFKHNLKLTSLLPESYAVHCKAIVLQKSQGKLWLGMADPSNLAAIDELKRVLKQPLAYALVDQNKLKQFQNLVYRNTGAISSLAHELDQELNTNNIKMEKPDDELGQKDAPVVKLLQKIFDEALKLGASDIHLEPCIDGLRIRMRVDGILQEQIMKETAIVPALTQRLKLMARIDISEKKRPQDGHFGIGAGNKKIDVRLSTLPSSRGESVVMRLLGQNADNINIHALGIPEAMQRTFTELTHQPYGMVLVTGPTGSGKSTTLFVALSDVDAKRLKVMTIEDPIEYQIEDVVQTQIQTNIDLKFSDILRTSLRQDPDVIMIGEIRDQETATIAIRAALTGHLVFSTLHTNDATSTAIRLIDMGIETFLVADALNGILAQRLSRKICDNCRTDAKLTKAEQTLLESIRPGVTKDHTFKVGKGCQYCLQTGYKGRIGIYELLVLTPQIREALRLKDIEHYTDLAKAALKNNFLADDALNKAISGIISVSEVMRISGTQIK